MKTDQMKFTVSFALLCSKEQTAFGFNVFILLPYSSWLIVESRLKEYYVFHNLLCQVFDSLRDRFTFQ
jgi:hypothetical protein